MAGTIYPGQAYPGGESINGSVYTPLGQKENTEYLYKVYDKDWNFLGTWDDVVSEFGYSQEINSAGSTIDIVLARNSDTLEASYDSLSTDENGALLTDDDNQLAAEVTTSNSIGPGTTIDLNLNVKIYEFSSNTTSVEGDLVFTGYISKYTSQYGQQEQTKVSLYSYGADLDNTLLTDENEDGTINTRVSYQSKDPSAILTDALDKFAAANGLITYTQGLPVTSVVTNLIQNPSFESSTNNWNTAYGITTRQTSGGAQGDAYLMLQNNMGGIVSNATENLEYGKKYYFSIYLKKPASGSVGLTCTHNGNTVLELTPSVPNSWTRYSGSFVATANAPFYTSVSISGSDNAVYIDGAMLTQSDTLLDYFDGNSTSVDPNVSYDWTGDDNDSSSTESTILSYSGGTIQYTDSLITYIFNLNTILEVVNQCLTLAPTDWFYYVDLASNQLYFQPRPTEVDHYFYLGKHVLSLNLERSMESIVNDLVISGGSPTTMVKDLFSGLNGTDLEDHTGELNASWSKHPSANAGSIVLQGGRIVNDSTSQVVYLASGTTYTTDYVVSTDLRATTGTSSIEIIGRADPTALTFYMARLTGTKAQLYKFVSGTSTLLQEANFTTADNSTYSLTLGMEGKRISFIVNNNTLCDVDDTSIPSGNRAGIRANGTAGSATTGFQLNNFKVEATGSFGPSVFKRYINQDSIDDWRRGLSRTQDSRITTESAADAIAYSQLARQKDPQYTSQITITAATYPIRTIKPGDLIGFRNFGNFIDAVTMQVVRIDYSPDQVVLSLDTLPPSVPKRIEDIKRNLNQSDVEDNPDSPTLDV